LRLSFISLKRRNIERRNNTNIYQKRGHGRFDILMQLRYDENMQMIRTTINMPKEVHKSLKREAMDKEVSLNELLMEKIKKELDTKKKMIAKRKKALREIRRLTKGINFKGINYKELIEDGRRY